MICEKYCNIVGLGFNIRGGVDIPYLPGETGIFVTKIREDGAAFKDGRLQEGDKILEVNGTKLERVTHNEAVQAFINAGETVILQVIAGEEARISVSIYTVVQVWRRNFHLEKVGRKVSSTLFLHG
ncbi:hypothetical protein FSP39_007319 [Pinctada imbricata]|uniref:PDZ domain-containing protein n=1 Tax=Pinctada imbricata TaxID=66713 RepID=A0AA89BRG7_PINIB|nr:hypothetical protein FSP39_007319 [Pinctada imbricata]